MKARVTVTLKTGVLDPQGKAIEGALASLGIDGVASVRQGKIFDVELYGVEPAAAEALLKGAADRLLANTVIENYRIEIEGAAAPSAKPRPRRSTEDPFSPDGSPDRSAEAARRAEMPPEGHP